MKFIAKILSSIKTAIVEWFVPPFTTIIVEDPLPAKLKRRALYIVKEDGFEEQAAMICPCGCKQVLHMNLLTDERPCWGVTLDKNGSATLQPSVWRKVGCKSHFWFRNGRVKWCK